jgi:hypothetical protein
LIERTIAALQERLLLLRDGVEFLLRELLSGLDTGLLLPSRSGRSCSPDYRASDQCYG